MPARYKPQLNHIGFDWFYQSNRFLNELLAKEIPILERLGFYKEYGSLEDPTFSGHVESMNLMNEICGILSVAATIQMDAGFKAPHQVIATLEAIKKDPSLVITHSIEPEALGAIARCYQRGQEAPGTFWFDIDRAGNTPLPNPDQVRAAASNAIASLKLEASPGRRPDRVGEFLAVRFREIFLRFNDRITRHSVVSSRDVKSGLSSHETKEVQLEAGPFIEFLELVLEPLNQFFLSLPKYYGARRISAGAVAEVVRDRRGLRTQRSIKQHCSLSRLPNSPHKFHRELHGSIVFNRLIRINVQVEGEAREQCLHRRIPPGAPASSGYSASVCAGHATPTSG
ncbi:MAG: hypothetical protein JWP25_8332 [Bradyrhizobium sp.]|nr:hypothetical protein [Bradyrhizobium sp.]